VTSTSKAAGSLSRIAEEFTGNQSLGGKEAGNTVPNEKRE